MLHQVVLKELLEDGCAAAQVMLGITSGTSPFGKGWSVAAFTAPPGERTAFGWTADSMTPSLSASRWSMQRNTFSHRTFGHLAYGIFPP